MKAPNLQFHDGSTLTNTIDCRVEVDLSGSFDEKSAGSEI